MFLYLSIVAVAAVMTIGLNIWLGTPYFGYIWWQVILMVIASIVFEVIIDAFFAFITARLPAKAYKNEGGLYKTTKGEVRLYEHLGIKKWKDKIWELGKLNGFSKSSIADFSSPEYFDRFILESKIGILGHFLGAVLGFGVMFIFPIKYALVIGLPVALTNAIINLMSLMVLKYNMPKLRVARERARRNKERLKGDKND